MLVGLGAGCSSGRTMSASDTSIPTNSTAALPIQVETSPSASDQAKEISKLRKENEALKKSRSVVRGPVPAPRAAYVPTGNVVGCNNISLDRYAPGYTIEDLQDFVNSLNSSKGLKNVSTADSKYVIDTYFAHQWETARPECAYFIKNLVESRRATNRQMEQLQKISDQQEKLLQYNQCLLAADQSTCQSLLY